ncbi:MAG: hypothetical protein OMM_05087 [Candidatus Magnetoglobus multicellularis str. Araruama]|uniref:Uncharacterized protein n=1 Tax=Candidatus Magnetoglobus multicellularis str. Araruama TaxID=890399 RepID=A0A1V1NYA2_9BACT|nr:MAG: hypothetical protein OMM_05087 [Candidatus Magnetoglobus multicellularis str. Araruama]
MKEKMKVQTVLIAFIFLCFTHISLLNSFATGATHTFPLYLKKGWNLISLPVYPEDSFQLPDSLIIYEYVDGSYVTASDFIPGKGYWIKSSENITYNISGTPFSKYSKELTAGWNIVSAVNQDVRPMTIPENTIICIFAYRNGVYQKVKTLEPGYGYWVHLKKSSVLTVQKSENLARLIRSNSPEEIENTFKRK